LEKKDIDMTEQHITERGRVQDSWRWHDDVLVHTGPHYTIFRQKFTTIDNLQFWMSHLSSKKWVTKGDLVVIVQKFVEKNQAELKQAMDNRIAQQERNRAESSATLRERLLQRKAQAPAERVERGSR
jgi:hypothetical protein